MRSLYQLGMLVGVLLISLPIAADDVILKEGPAITGVRAYIGTNFVFAVSQDGRIQEIAKQRIKGLIRKPVRFSEASVQESVEEVRGKVGRWRVAVAPIAAGRNTDPALAQTATESILAEIVATKRFIVVERGAVKAIFDEQALSKSGLMDGEAGARLGRLLSAGKILSGTVTRNGEAISISARLIDVEKGRIETAAQVTVAGTAGVRAGMKTLVADLLSGLADPGSRRPFVLRSLVLPGWGQLEDGGGSKSYAFLGMTAALLANGWSSYGAYRTAKQEYDNAIIIPAGLDAGQDTLLLNLALNSNKEANYRKAGARLNAGLALLAAFWAYNVFDAWLFPSGGNQPFFIRHEATRPLWFIALVPESDDGPEQRAPRAQASFGVTITF